jgi:hypothetical protein
MPRLTVSEARALFDQGATRNVVEYDWDRDRDQMMDTMTGLVGLCLAEKFDFLIGPQVRCNLPIMVLNMPHGMPQILVDPHMEQRKGRHLVVTALSYKEGDVIKIDTSRVTYTDGEAMAEALESAINMLRVSLSGGTA